MPVRSRNPEAAILDLEILSLPKRPHRRWRMAFMAISFTTALASLSKTVIHNQTKPLRSLPYIAINITSDSVSHTPSSSFDLKALAHITKERSLKSLEQLGGVEELVKLLKSDLTEGIIPNDQEYDLAHRRRFFGANKCQTQSAKRFPSFFLEAWRDMTAITLLSCAVMSLALGTIKHGLKDGWYGGGSILVALFLLVAVSAWSKFNQSREFQRLFDQRSNIKVKVVRSGMHQDVPIFDVVVGDVVHLEIGDQVPADGLLLHGGPLSLDESSVTGKTEQVEVNGTNPFLFSGTKVADGAGRMLVTSVGMNTIWGEMLSSQICNLTNEITPLQARIKKLSSKIGKVEFVVAALVLVALLIWYLTGSTRDDNGHREFNGRKTKAIDVLNSIVGIITGAVSISGSLSSALWLILTYSKWMLKDTAIVRNLSACETMGSSTTICTDKTGTLTLMKVTEFWLGKEAVEVDVSKQIDPALSKLLQEGIALNKNDNTVCQQPSTSTPEISDSSMQNAILSWATLDLGMNINEIKTCNMTHVQTFNSEEKRSGVLVWKSNDNTIHSHWKGAPEMIIAMCSNYYTLNGEVKTMNKETQMQFEEIAQSMAEKSSRCIAFAHKMAEEVDGQVSHKLEETGLTLTGLVGLEDVCRPGVKKAVESCKRAGVSVKMVTGDNVHAARAIAIECGILTSEEDMEDKAIVAGVTFRNYSLEERMDRIEDIRVMARSSPLDKLLMVQCLKKKGHVVAVTGDGTNDGPALLEADIGLSMGIQGTEVAKKSSDILILDDNFASVVTVSRWGRCVYDNVCKFIQCELTVNISALAINIILAVSSGKSPLTEFQQLWVNLVMDTLGALALATELPTSDLIMTFPPVPRDQSLVTIFMWRDAIAQVIYQVAILTTLYSTGKSTFGMDEKVNATILFNTFFLCQVFNLFNARILDRINVLKDIHKNKLFLATVGITMVLQVLMVELMNRFSGAERLTWGQWGASFGVAAISLPIACIVKCIPGSNKGLD